MLGPRLEPWVVVRIGAQSSFGVMPELAIAVSWHCPNSAFGFDYAGRYRLGRKIGSGSFGDIYLGARLHLAVTFPLAGPPKRAKTFAHTAIYNPN